MAGPPFAYFSEKYDFTFVETVGYCVAGGMLGVFVFTYFSPPILKAWNWLTFPVRKFFHRPKNRIFSEPEADVEGNMKVKYEYISEDFQNNKKFTPFNRKMVRVWKKYGMAGLAFITPVIISIPIGTVIMNSLVKNKKKIFLFMFFSILFWSVFMTSMFELFHASDIFDLQKKMTE